MPITAPSLPKRASAYAPPLQAPLSEIFPDSRRRHFHPPPIAACRARRAGAAYGARSTSVIKTTAAARAAAACSWRVTPAMLRQYGTRASVAGACYAVSARKETDAPPRRRRLRSAGKTASTLSPRYCFRFSPLMPYLLSDAAGFAAIAAAFAIFRLMPFC
jgi:hypothetical protein